MWIAISNAIGSRQLVGGGPGPGPGYTPPLDTFTGAVAAFSVRKLSSSYSGPCIEAYRVSDGATQNIGFDADGLIDTAAIATFASGSDVRVSVWYDQSGSGNDAINNNTVTMPIIYNGTAVTTENGKPAIDFLLNDDRIFNSVTGLNFNTNDVGIFVVCTAVTGHNPYATAVNIAPGVSTEIIMAYRTEQISYTGTQLGTGTSDTTQNLVSLYADNASNDVRGYIDGTELGTTTTSSNVGTSFQIGSLRGIGSAYWEGTIQEVIFYPSSTKSNHTAIESNINGYFNVYTEYNPDAPTSGFLFDYSGAAVAYSVRQLNDNATYAMRVRRTVAPFDEQDIGFDGSGNLDTTAISTFGGSDSLTVSRWYDQTGNQNHATQGTAGSQPQIYDGSTVTDVIGRPGVDFYNVIDRYMQFSEIASSGSDFTVSYVGALNGDSRNSIVGLRGTGTSNTRYIRTSFQKINVSGYQSAYGTIASGLNEYSIIVTNQSQAGTVYRNNSSIVTGTTDSALAFDTIGGTDTGNAGVHSEIVIWESVLSTTDRTGVYNNQDTYYSIP
jgi:hypothetical protein